MRSTQVLNEGDECYAFFRRDPLRQRGRFRPCGGLLPPRGFPGPEQREPLTRCARYTPLKCGPGLGEPTKGTTMRLLDVEYDDKGTITATISGSEEEAEALDDLAGCRIEVTESE